MIPKARSKLLVPASSASLAMAMSMALLSACSASSSEHPVGTGGTGATGASAGHGGMAASGNGAGGGAVPGQPCGPVSMVITDFTYMAGAPKDSVIVGTPRQTFSGQCFGYGSGITTDVSGNDGHISGAVTDSAGVHVVFDQQCIADASTFQGITFDIWGSISEQAPNKTITFWVATQEDTPTAEWLANAPSPSPGAGGAGGSSNAQGAGGTSGAGGAGGATTAPKPSTLPPMPGVCTPTSGNRVIHPGCRNPVYTFDLSGTQGSPQRLAVKWTDFMAGQPNADASPGKITYIGWRLPQATGTGTASVTPFTADIHVDNIAFIPR